MPRPIWSGAVSFGLVSIPVAMVPATESHDVSFKQIHLEDGGRIRYRKVCEPAAKKTAAKKTTAKKTTARKRSA